MNPNSDKITQTIAAMNLALAKYMDLSPGYAEVNPDPGCRQGITYPERLEPEQRRILFALRIEAGFTSAADAFSRGAAIGADFLYCLNCMKKELDQIYPGNIALCLDQDVKAIDFSYASPIINPGVEGAACDHWIVFLSTQFVMETKEKLLCYGGN